MLRLAAKMAAESKDKHKSFSLACIAQRSDGVFVFATNIICPEHKTPSAHAEARALRKSTSNSILWVARVLKDGSWALAKPCETCQSLIINRRVKKVYYTIGPLQYEVWNP